MNYKVVGIIGAMDVEVELIIDEIKKNSVYHETCACGMRFNIGVIAGITVIVVRSGVGMVNASLCAQILIDKFDVDAIINTGIAGSLDTNIDICDMVIGSAAVNHLMNVENLGYKKGQVPGIDTITFPCDSELSGDIKHAAEQLGIRTHEGIVASGDKFVCSTQDKDFITSTFGAKCCEMEGAAIAQACYLSKTPCAIVRSISDKADGSSYEDYPTFEAKAAKQSAQLMVTMLQNL